MVGKNGLLKSINKKVDQISLNIEKSKITDYVNYLEHPRKLIVSNFIGGLSHGLGIAIGVTILGAIVIYVLQTIVKWNLPYIGDYIADIVKIVQDSMDKRR